MERKYARLGVGVVGQAALAQCLVGGVGFECRAGEAQLPFESLAIVVRDARGAELFAGRLGGGPALVVGGEDVADAEVVGQVAQGVRLDEGQVQLRC